MKVLGRGYPSLRKVLIDDLRGVERVLEIASGTGQVTLAIAPHVGRLEATDVSPEMVNILQGKIDAEGLHDKVHASVQSAYDLPYEDASFDAAVCVAGLHVMGEADLALSELRP